MDTDERSGPAQPEFVLFASTDDEASIGHWRIMLGRPEGDVLLDVEAVETDITGERLDLLSVIRGLEALEQPSRVVLFTSSRYVHRGLRFGLESWRRTSWRWERFGRMVPITNDDLWRRLDRALQYHQLECRYYRFDRGMMRDEPAGETAMHAA